MKLTIVFTMLALFFYACFHSNNEPNRVHETSDEQLANRSESLEAKVEPTLEQQSAFEALNTLQVSTDKRNRLYSTFAGIDQPCYPPDTSFVISQSELLFAIKAFVETNCKNLSIKERNQLTKRAVLAQKDYTLSLCLDNVSIVDFENGTPMMGTWVMPSILERRDLIIVW